jgi:phospholipid/cholesterol/gamma-HCH transport system substrate-binding protein
MKERKAELIVGLVVTAGVLLLVLGVVWGKKASFFSNWSVRRIRFEDVRGLESGDPVVVRGISQGAVNDIRLHPGWVEVKIRIRKSVRLAEDAAVFIEDRSVMGGKQVRVDPGISDTLLAEDAVLTGRIRGDMLQALASGGKVLSQVDSLVGRLMAIADTERLAAVLHNVESTSRQARGILDDNRAAIRATLSQLEAVTRSLKDDSTAVRLGGTVTRLDSTIAVIQRVAAAAESEDGTFQKLMRDRALYDRLLNTSRDIDTLVVDFKKNPQKYIRVTVF